MSKLHRERLQNQPDARHVCTLCGDLAEFREDEQGWRHAGNSKARGLIVPGEGCDRYGYMITVEAASPEAGKPLVEKPKCQTCDGSGYVCSRCPACNGSSEAAAPEKEEI